MKLSTESRRQREKRETRRPKLSEELAIAIATKSRAGKKAKKQSQLRHQRFYKEQKIALRDNRGKATETKQ